MSNEAEFTKGDWYVDDSYATFFLIASGATLICEVESVDEDGYCTPTGEQKANARLIAAAPKMYKSIEDDIAWLTGCISAMSVSSESYRQLSKSIIKKKALLAEARGEI